MPGAIPYLTAYGWGDNEAQILVWGEMWSPLPAPAAAFEAIGEEPWTTFYCPESMWIAHLMRVLIYPSVELYLDKSGCTVGASVYAPHVAAIGDLRVGSKKADVDESPGAWENRRLPHPWLPGAWVIDQIEPKYWGGVSAPRPGTRVKSVLFETDNSAEHRITAIHSGFSYEMWRVVENRSRLTDKNPCSGGLVISVPQQEKPQQPPEPDGPGRVSYRPAQSVPVVSYPTPERVLKAWNVDVRHPQLRTLSVEVTPYVGGGLQISIDSPGDRRVIVTDAELKHRWQQPRSPTGVAVPMELRLTDHGPALRWLAPDHQGLGQTPAKTM